MSALLGSFARRVYNFRKVCVKCPYYDLPLLIWSRTTIVRRLLSSFVQTNVLAAFYCICWPMAYFGDNFYLQVTTSDITKSCSESNFRNLEDIDRPPGAFLTPRRSLYEHSRHMVGVRLWSMKFSMLALPGTYAGRIYYLRKVCLLYPYLDLPLSIWSWTTISSWRFASLIELHVLASFYCIGCQMIYFC